MNIADQVRRAVRTMPLAVMSVEIIASYAGAVLVIWVLLRLLWV